MYIWWVGSWRDGLRNSPALDTVLGPGILGSMSEHKLLYPDPQRPASGHNILES